MKTKKTAAILLSAVLMLAMLSGCMHVEEKIRFNSDGTVLGGAGIYYSESFFKLIETTPEDYYHAIFADGGMKEEEYPKIISKKIGDETYYGIYEEDLLDVTQAMESSDLSGDTNPIFAFYSEGDKTVAKISYVMKSDEDVLDEDLNVGSEDVEASSQEDLDLSNLLSLEMTVIFTDGVKGVTGIPAEAYKISGNTVVINLSSSEDSQEFSVEGYVSGDVYKSYALPAVSALPFTDVKTSDYFYKAVLWAYTAQPQITDGMSPTLFGTGKTCTRGQVVTFLWRTAGCPEPKNAQNPFTDVAASDYFYKPVLWAVEQGITDGTSPTAFSPAKPCTNAHIITFIYRAVGEPGKTANPAAWYTDAYFWAGEHKLLTGTYTGTFDLNAPCPRENVVTYLYRYNESK